MFRHNCESTTHHITCTDTGLKTWVRPAVFTLNPLWCKHKCWSSPQRRIIFRRDPAVLAGGCVPSRNSPVAVQVDRCVAPQRQHHSNGTAFAGRRENQVCA